MATELKDRVRALREALELTQVDVATAGGFAGQGQIAKIETGTNKLRSDEARERLARGLGLTREDLESYLRGRLELREVLPRVRPRAAEPGALTHAPDPAPPVDTASGAVSPLEAALSQAFDGDRHLIRDVDAVRFVLRNSHQMQAPERDLVEAARTWLDCAAQLRREGEAVTVDSLLLRVTIGRKPSAHDLAKAREIDAAAEREQREAAAKRGIEWSSKRAAVEKIAGKKPRGE